ncbi:hypothetical protein ACIBG8_09830 [Nonomuraea sp. NPDC050556]|uniref:hypothetical protein n=1 Tax=Nonomuraea sp. NPDC050556 TaxID=3364369 RepID=UPI0037A91037
MSRLPILVICELLGVPYEDRPQFRTWSQQTADVTNRELSEQGLLALYGYGQDLVRRKRKEPGEDFISQMIDRIPDDEIAMLSMAMLFAGHETTVVAIELGAVCLLTNPEQWQLLLQRPELIPGAVDEMLRLSKLLARFPVLRLAVPAEQLRKHARASVTRAASRSRQPPVTVAARVSATGTPWRRAR